VKDVSLFPADTQEAVHEAFAKALGFPAHAGKNLDALHDCLGDVAEPTRVTLYDLPSWRRRLGEDFCRRLASVLASAAAENPAFRAAWTLDPAPDDDADRT